MQIDMPSLVVRTVKSPSAADGHLASHTSSCRCNYHSVHSSERRGLQTPHFSKSLSFPLSPIRDIVCGSSARPCAASSTRSAPVRLLKEKPSDNAHARSPQCDYTQFLGSSCDSIKVFEGRYADSGVERRSCLELQSVVLVLVSSIVSYRDLFCHSSSIHILLLPSIIFSSSLLL